MNEKSITRRIDFRSTKAIEIKSQNTIFEQKIDWASQVLITNQTRAIFNTNYQKKVNITIQKNAKWR